jgi:hypothetical protein
MNIKTRIKNENRGIVPVIILIPVIETFLVLVLVLYYCS